VIVGSVLLSLTSGDVRRLERAQPALEPAYQPV
jgi:hypothetical protein